MTPPLSPSNPDRRTMNGVCEQCGASIELCDETRMDFGPHRGKFFCDNCWDDEPIPARVVAE